jgi:transposase
MSTPGRPTKLTKAIQDEIVRQLRLGNYIETAAAIAGIHKSTLYDWLKRGARSDEKDDRYARFSDAVKKAQAESEAFDLAVITRAAQQHWQAAAWRLERRFPDRWGRRDHIQHSGEGGGPIPFQIIPFKDESDGELNL